VYPCRHAEQPQRHLCITTGAMPRYCLIPGDPARAERIAARFDSSEETIRNREFLGFRGTAGGIPIGVCSTGIGGPSASIAVEELSNVGVDIFIRVGSAGGRQETIPVGSLVVTGAYGARVPRARICLRSSPPWPTSGSPLRSSTRRRRWGSSRL
jgi:uridine phosphorylase